MKSLIVLLAACGTEAPQEPVPDLAAMEEAEKKAFLMELGAEVYMTCRACHQEDGRGLPPSFPPLVGQREHMGDCAKHAGIVVHGLQGEIVVDGTTYDGVMPAQGSVLDDLEIAAVLTYERHSWGNDYGICLPEQVAAVRAAH